MRVPYFNLLVEAMFSATVYKNQNTVKGSLYFNLLVEAMFSATIQNTSHLRSKSFNFNLLVEAMFSATQEYDLSPEEVFKFQSSC